MEDKVLIAVDLDDTLLKKDKSVSDYTLDVLSRCKQKGAILVISTARGYGNTEHYARLIGADYCCCQTGNFIIDSGAKEIYVNPLDNEVKNAALDTFSKYTDEIFCDGLYCLYGIESEYSRSWNVTSCDMDYLKSLKTLKICIRHTDEYVNEIIEFCKKNNVTHRFMRGADFSFIAPLNSDKWNALEKLMEIHSIKKENVYAFGDDVADILSLVNAGHGVAMQNSKQEVLERNFTLTLSNEEDGVAHYLENNYLKD